MTLLDLSRLPPGQRRAIEALIGSGESARTYGEAAEMADVPEGTMLTHVNRVRENRPQPYKAIRKVRRAQLAVYGIESPWQTPGLALANTSDG